MPFILQVHPHLTSEALVERFKWCKNAGERLRLQAVMLKSEGWSAKAIADSCKRREDWVRRTVHVYNDGGPEALEDGPWDNGRERVLGVAACEQLSAALLQPPPAGPETEAPRRRSRGPRGLQKRRLQKRGLQSCVRDVVRAHPEAEVQVWAEDEGRFGLILSYRRVWAKKGQRPVASSRRRYKWASLFSFVRPSSGETVNFMGSTVSSAIMSAVLRDFAEAAGLGAKRRAVVVLDGAGWHTARDLVVPEGVHIAKLPAYSPELQPAERLWPTINEGVANRTFPTLEELMKGIESRCAHMENNRDQVRARTKYHGWPTEHLCEG